MHAMITSPKSAISVAVLSIALAFYYGIGWEHQYVFNPEDMQSIAQSAIASSTAASTNGTADPSVTIAFVIDDLRARYGDHIADEPKWMLNNAGGAMGAMQVLHFSMSEYIIIFGTAVGTEGHTGRFLADDYFTVLHGEQWAFAAGSIVKEVYRPGEQHVLPYGVGKQYRIPDEGWALEYCRGNIVSMLPFGFADALSSTMDFVTLWQTVECAAVGVVRNLLKGKV